MLLVGGVRVALTSLLAACTVLSFKNGSGVSASPADKSASTTTSTGTDASSAVLTTTTSPSLTSTSSDGTSASSITSQVTATTSGDTSTKTTESMATSMSSSITSSSEPQSAAPSTTTNGTTVSDDPRPSRCTHPTGPFAPFCKPNDGEEYWVGETYDVVWDPSYYTANSTIILQLNYADVLPHEGRQAWQSAETRNGYGFIAVTMEKAWLRDQARNNLTFYIIQMDPTPDARASERRGPTISLTDKPVTHLTPRPQPKTSRLGLLVGLPVALGVMALIVCGLFLGKRKTRQLGVGKVMGRRRGYGVRQSRCQRMRGRRRGGAAAAAGGLDDDDDDDGADKAYVTDEGFRDEPTRGGVELEERPARPAGRSTRATRVDSPGGSAGEERYTDDATGPGEGREGASNAFREEVERQQRGRRL